MQQPVDGISSSIEPGREGVLWCQGVLHCQDGAVNALRQEGPRANMVLILLPHVLSTGAHSRCALCSCYSYKHVRKVQA
jgi:hypothetical protein